MTIGKINPRRLTVIVSLLLFALLSAWTGSWRHATEYHKLLRQFQYRIVAEEYAVKNGTTIEEINLRFLDNEQKRYRQDRDSGLPDCSWFLTKDKPCARLPLTFGGPLIGFPTGTYVELFEANKRAIPSLMPLLIDLLKSVFAAATICLAVPLLAGKVWKWLQGGGRSMM
jgi:hypothetical protein